MNTSVFSIFRFSAKNSLVLLLVASIPLLLGIFILDLPHWDLSVPLIYRNSDDIWQLVLTKMLRDTGWILSNPFLGAPDIANWHNNAAAQTSALHSVLMLGLSFFIDDAVKIQQVYYLLNFALISLSSFVACRLLGIARLPAFCVGILYAFTTFRINEMLYAFLSNYFMVPLALVPVIWIMTGVFQRLSAQAEISCAWPTRVNRLLRSREFLLGLVFIVLMALSDGYYAFFTLLLLGFALFIRVLSGDLKSPISLLIPVIYIVSLMAASLALSWPLHSYKIAHLDEFFPSGVQDPSLVKHPFEAEVYSTTLKMLVAPPPNHRIKRMGDVGKYIVETSDGARLFKNGRNLVPLGTLGSILFGVSLIYLAVPKLRRGQVAIGEGAISYERLGNAFLSLIFFIFLCSILGGVGTLVALVFPTIRGYDRFPLFMIFVLYAQAAYFATFLLAKGTLVRRLGYGAALLLLTMLSLFDQIPKNVSVGDPQVESIFLAERKFVRAIEESLPKGAMIYQYPHSQYLENNKYYGWGSFSHVRLYLHSVAMRWSNGGSKNSPVENWHLRNTLLPLDDRLTEIEAAGFAGLVVDRAVVSESEYLRLRQALAAHGADLVDDASSRLSYAKLRDNSFRIEYEKNYREAARIVINDRSRLTEHKLSNYIDRLELSQFLARQPEGQNTFVVERSDQPKVFLSNAMFFRGMGLDPILPLADMKGEISCNLTSDKAIAKTSDTVILTLKNQSDFTWKFNTGPYPIRIGVHIRRMDGTVLRFDDGLRLSTETPANLTDGVTSGDGGLSIPLGATGQLRFPLSQLNLKGLGEGNQDLIADFRMVQDGHAWFEDIGCKIVVRN